MVQLFDAGLAGRFWLWDRMIAYGGDEPEPWLKVAGAIMKEPDCLLEGQVLVLSESPPPQRIWDFRWGWSGGVRLDEAREILTGFISEFLAGSKDRACLIGEPNSRPGDLGWERWRRRELREHSFVTCNRSIIYVISPTSRRDLEEIMKDVFGGFLCIALVECPAEVRATFEDRSQIEKTHLEAAVRGLCGIAVDALDGESAVLWTPRTSLAGMECPW